MRRNATCALLMAVLTAAAPALAQQDDAATAYSLFEQGRQLVSAGKLDEACPKLLASERLVPKVSTLLNLADCYERSGRVASAWARFAEAGALARQQGQTEREIFARDRAAALEPKLPRVTIVAPPVAGLTVKRDDAEVLSGVLGAAVPVDPGPHLVEASAPGKKPWSVTVPVELAGAVTVTIPALEDVAPPTAQVPAAPVTAPAISPQPPEAPPSRGSSTLGTVGLVTGAAGVVGLGVGAVFGGVALSKKNQAESLGCSGNQCSSLAAGRARDDAKSAAGNANIAFASGGVLLAAGAALWLFAPRSTATVQVTPSAGPGSAGLAVAGAF